MTAQPIQVDLESQVCRFVALVRETFDAGRYPRLADGPEFDQRYAELEKHFEALGRLFQDYLMATWSGEISARLGRS